LTVSGKTAGSIQSNILSALCPSNKRGTNKKKKRKIKKGLTFARLFDIL
jgi:hypothetical protein